MRCFYHPDDEAVGVCSVCGKALCRRSAADIEWGLACKEGDCANIMKFRRGERVGNFKETMEVLKNADPRKYQKMKAKLWVFKFYLVILGLVVLGIIVYMIKLYYS
ncbi:MAG TPA: hypothetical protein VJJ24_01555 [Candidatus Paceibacterota bacterium]